MKESQNHSQKNSRRLDTLFDRLKIIVRWKDGRRRSVPETTSWVNERIRVSGNSCIKELDGKGIRLRGLSVVTSF